MSFEEIAKSTMVKWMSGKVKNARMMEDQVMILICMVMKGMRNGYEAVLLHPFPIRLLYGYIS